MIPEPILISLGISLPIFVFSVLFGEYKLHQATKGFREREEAWAAERKEILERHLVTVKELSMLLKSDTPVQAVDAIHAEKVHEMERETIEYWQKQQDAMATKPAPIPDKITTDNGRTLTLVGDY